MRRSRSTTIAFGAAGALLVLLPFLPLLFDPSVAILYRDVSNIMLPYKATWLAAVRELGRLPQWDPFHAAGYRFLADLGYGPLYPLNVLLLAAGKNLARGLTFWILLHHALIFLGQFLFLRDARVRAWLAAAGALALAWSGPVMSADCLLHHLGSQVAVGFFFFFWRRALRGNGKSLFAASLALAWPVYAGDPQYSFFLAAAAAIMAAQKMATARAPRLLAALAALTVLASAPQLLPTAHELSTNGRLLDAQTDDDRLAWSLHPARLGELLFPSPFGRDPEHYTARNLLGGASEPFVFSQYAGCILVALAAVHLALRRRRRWLPLSVFAALTLLTLGAYSPIPLFQLFLKVVPFWRSFRFPERIGFWLVYSSQVYGVLGAEKTLRLNAKLPWRWPALALSSLALGFGSWLELRGASLFPVARTILFLAALIPVFLLQKKARAAILACLIIADLAPVAEKLVWAQPIAFTEASTFPYAGKILADRSKGDPSRGEAGRFFSAVNAPVPLPPGMPQGAGVAAVYSAWSGMKFGTPSYWGIPLVRGHSTMAPDRPVLHLVSQSPALVQRALDLLSVRYILAPDLGAQVNPRALPAVFFPKLVEGVQDEEHLEAALQNRDWDPAVSALVEAAAGQATVDGDAEILGFDQHWDEITVKLRAASPRWLVLNEAYDPQWKVSVGGTELPLSRANGWAMAVPVPKGELTLNFEYRDRWFELGLALFASWALALAAVILRERWPSRLPA